MTRKIKGHIIRKRAENAKAKTLSNAQDYSERGLLFSADGNWRVASVQDATYEARLKVWVFRLRFADIDGQFTRRADQLGFCSRPWSLPECPAGTVPGRAWVRYDLHPNGPKPIKDAAGE